MVDKDQTHKNPFILIAICISFVYFNCCCFGYFVDDLKKGDFRVIDPDAAIVLRQCRHSATTAGLPANLENLENLEL